MQLFLQSAEIPSLATSGHMGVNNRFLANCYDGDVVYLKIRHCTKSCGFRTAGMSFVLFKMVDYGIIKSIYSIIHCLYFIINRLHMPQTYFQNIM